MQENPKIKVLEGLPIEISHDRSLRKAFETYIYLKHYHSNGTVWKYSQVVYQLAEECKISVRTFWTRLRSMIENGLVSKINGHLYLASWTSLMKRYGMLKKRFYHVKETLFIYDNRNKLEYFLEVKALFEKKKQMHRAFKYKLEKYDDLRQVIYDNVGVNELEPLIEALQNRQLSNFITRMENRKDEFINLLNPFFDLNMDSLAKLINMRASRSAGTYSKKKWVKHGYVDIEVRMVDSDQRARETYLGGYFYSHRDKKTHVRMPDEILFKINDQIEAIAV